MRRTNVDKTGMKYAWNMRFNVSVVCGSVQCKHFTLAAGLQNDRAGRGTLNTLPPPHSWGRHVTGTEAIPCPVFQGGCKTKSKCLPSFFPLASDEGEVMLVKKWINEKKKKSHHSPGPVALPDSSFYHVNKANGTGLGGQFPSRHLGQIQLSCALGPQWGMYLEASVLI